MPGNEKNIILGRILCFAQSDEFFQDCGIVHVNFAPRHYIFHLCSAQEERISLRGLLVVLEEALLNRLALINENVNGELCWIAVAKVSEHALSHLLDEWLSQVVVGIDIPEQSVLPLCWGCRRGGR